VGRIELILSLILFPWPEIEPLKQNQPAKRLTPNDQSFWKLSSTLLKFRQLNTEWIVWPKQKTLVGSTYLIFSPHLWKSWEYSSSSE